MDQWSPDLSGGLKHRYDAEDLHTFKHVVRGVVGNLHARQSPLVHPDEIEVTIIRVAAAIFELADLGVRDPERLQKFTEARIAAADYSDGTGTHPVAPTRH